MTRRAPFQHPAVPGRGAGRSRRVRAGLGAGRARRSVPLAAPRDAGGCEGPRVGAASPPRPAPRAGQQAAIRGRPVPASPAVAAAEGV